MEPSLLLLFLLVGHVGLAGDKLRKVGPVQYLLHTCYALLEPSLLRLMDRVLDNWFFGRTRVGRWLLRFGCRQSWYLPHGVVLTTEAAERLLDFITATEGPRGARLAVGPCVCQSALDRWQEPSKKDMVILYGADIYLRHYKDYTLIDAEEGKRLLRECHEKGLFHTVDFCMASGKWTFVVCNCEKDICLITRSYLVTGEFLIPGPEVVTHDRVVCLGEKECGRCLTRCMFGANLLADGKPEVLADKCLGCGLCVTTCPSGARKMTSRPDFTHASKVAGTVMQGLDAAGPPG